ncbi:MAG: hypothetical protein PVF33_02190 [Candidatus Latescibacterota bacterium]|jgi:hypothetical protein
MKRTKKTLGMLMAILFAAWMLPACSGDDGAGPTEPDYPADAPQLPSVSTMMFDVQFFDIETPQVSQQAAETGKPTGGELLAAESADRTHFINAFVRVLFLQLLMYDALEEPVGAFALAVHSVPQPQDDGSWLWTYIFVDEGIEYNIYLYGTPDTGDDHVDWRLEVSTNDPSNPFDHFVWFDGRTYNDDSQGYWQFYDPQLPAPHASARIDWENPSATEGRLVIEINGPDHPDYGDTLEFFESSFQCTVDHYDAGEDRRANITVNADGTGSLTVPDYNNGDRACWDTEQKNTDCPE